MKSNGGGTGRDFFIGSEGLNRHVVHFYAFQGMGIVCLQMGQFVTQARAGVRAAYWLGWMIEQRLFCENL